MNSDTNIPITCDLTAIPLAAREYHLREGVEIFKAVQEVKERADGYAFRFAAEPGRLLALASFVENERLCCPFYAFTIEVEPGGKAIWLQLTGGEGVKEFVRAMLSDTSTAPLNQWIYTGADEKLDQAVVDAAAGLAGVLDKSVPTDNT